MRAITDESGWGVEIELDGSDLLFRGRGPRGGQLGELRFPRGLVNQLVAGLRLQAGAQQSTSKTAQPTLGINVGSGGLLGITMIDFDGTPDVLHMWLYDGAKHPPVKFRASASTLAVAAAIEELLSPSPTDALGEVLDS